MQRSRKCAALLLSLLLMAGTFCACDEQAAGRSAAAEPADGTGPGTYGLHAAADYSDVFSCLPNIRAKEMAAGIFSVDDAMVKTEAAVETPMEAPAAAQDMPAAVNADFGAAEEEREYALAGEGPVDDELGSGEDDHSETNVQVKGIDEGDIVKTDGKYIYVLRDEDFFILAPHGEDTELLSQTALWDHGDDFYEYSQEMYVQGDRVCIILSGYAYFNDENDKQFCSNGMRCGRDYCRQLFLDVSDPEAPLIAEETAQEGNYRSSRLYDGKLYVISSYYEYSALDKDDPQTFVPAVYNGKERALLAADRIFIPGTPARSVCYSVLRSIDYAAGEVESEAAVLGSASAVYMNESGLYLVESLTEEKESEPYTADQYTVVDYTQVQYSNISRFDIENGLALSGSCRIAGNLLNQFSLDEKDGYLRIAVTEQSYDYSIYTDEKYDWSNWKDGEQKQSNSLLVLDGDLNVCGSITGLAEGERLYSVRFSGDTAYFCTFEQTDPLFTADLSDPENPVIQSELELPGFSNYLHVYGQNRLMGLGQAVEDGMTTGMKLSMFDTEDPFAVALLNETVLDSHYSEALYNHKALLVSPSKDLIAFPGDEGFLVYGYNDEEGFYQKGSFPCDDWGYNSRGLYCGDYLYVITQDYVTVVDLLNDFHTVAKLALPRG